MLKLTAFGESMQNNNLIPQPLDFLLLALQQLDQLRLRAWNCARCVRRPRFLPRRFLLFLRKRRHEFHPKATPGLAAHHTFDLCVPRCLELDPHRVTGNHLDAAYKAIPPSLISLTRPGTRTVALLF